MEPTESGSVDDTIDSKNSEAEAEDVTKYEDTEALSSQAEEDTSGQQVYGYLYRSGINEDATIYVDPRGFNLNGQSLIVTQNDDGNEIIVLVEDPNVQTLDQTFAHTVLHSEDGVTFEDGLKEHTLVVDNQTPGIEFIKTSEEVPEERRVYIENSDEILNLAQDNVESPAGIESSPLWQVTNSAHLKNDGTEMLFIPHPTVLIAPEETKHRKLMQLACIAHELQSADQKSSSTATCEYVKDTESSLNEYGSSVSDIHQDEENNSAEDKHDETDECLNLSSKTTQIDSPVLPSTSEQAIDNTVSVIHSTSSEIRNCTRENHGIPMSPSSENNFPSSESGLPAEMLDSNVAFSKNTDESSDNKQLEECSSHVLEGKDQSSGSAQVDNLELSNKDSPLIFVEKSHTLNVYNLNAEDDTDPCSKEVDGANSSPLVIPDDENQKSPDRDSGLSPAECLAAKRSISERTELEDKVPIEMGSASDVDDDNVSSTEHSMSISENESSFLSSRPSALNRSDVSAKSPSEEDKVLSPAPQDNESQPDDDQMDMNESYELQIDESESNEIMETDLFAVPGNPQDSALNMAEPVQENHIDSSVIDETEPTQHSEDLKSTSADHVNDAGKSFLDQAIDTDKPNDVDRSVNSTKNAEDMNEAPVNEVSSKSTDVANDELDVANNKLDESYLNSDTEGLKVSKTYLIKKKIGKSVPKKETREPLELFVSEDFPILSNSVEPRLSSPTDNYASQENNTELDDPLVSDLQSKVSVKRTYSIPRDKLLFKRKILVPPKQVPRSTRLRVRSLSSAIRKNGSAEVSEGHSQQSSFDTSNTDNIPWGKVLLETSFEPRDLPNDVPSTSFALQYPRETSTPLVSPEQQRRKLNKYKRDFDRLLHSSSPIATKRPKIGRRYSSQMHPNVIKATKSKYSSFNFSRLFKSRSSRPYYRSSVFRTGAAYRRKKSRPSGEKKPKKAQIQYLEASDASPDHAFPKSPVLACSCCTFTTVYVDNLMEHLNYCTNREPVIGYEVNNMDKRQRIRGEEDITTTVTNTLKKIRQDFEARSNCSGKMKLPFMDEDPSRFLTYGNEERESDATLKKRRKFGYGEDDVVWVEFKKRYWPALVCKIDDSSAYVKLISYPEEKGLEVPHKKVRTFDNSKWNLLCLKNAERLPHNDLFVKGVQSCERFMSKKFLGIPVTGKQFFSVPDEVDFETELPRSERRRRRGSPVADEDSDSSVNEMDIPDPPRPTCNNPEEAKQILDRLARGIPEVMTTPAEDEIALRDAEITLEREDVVDLGGQEPDLEDLLKKYS